jgi:hypothetical protein
MQNSCWTVGEYIFATVASSALWFVCTALGGLVFYKLRHRIVGALQKAVQQVATPIAPPPIMNHGNATCPLCLGLGIVSAAPDDGPSSRAAGDSYGSVPIHPVETAEAETPPARPITDWPPVGRLGD